MFENHFFITLSAEAKKKKSLTLAVGLGIWYIMEENTFILISPHKQCSKLNAVGLALLLCYSLLLTNYDHFKGLNGAYINFGCNCKCIC